MAVLLAAAGFYLLVRRISLLVSGSRAIGHFVRWEERGLRKKYFYPVVRFQAHDEQVYDFVGAVGSSSKRERSHYHILYPAENPQAAMIHGPVAYWLAPLVFLVMATAAGFAASQQ